MKRFCRFLLIVIVLILNNQLRAQSITDTLSNLFFGTDVTHFDSTLVVSFKANKNLKYFNINAIIEDSRGAHAKNEFFHRFYFEDVIVNSDSLSGDIYLETKKVNGIEKVTNLILTYDKLNEKRATSLFNFLFKMFSNYYNKRESQLKMGFNNELKYFNFRQISAGAFLGWGNAENSIHPGYSVELILFDE